MILKNTCNTCWESVLQWYFVSATGPCTWRILLSTMEYHHQITQFKCWQPKHLGILVGTIILNYQFFHKYPKKQHTHTHTHTHTQKKYTYTYTPVLPMHPSTAAMSHPSTSLATFLVALQASLLWHRSLYLCHPGVAKVMRRLKVRDISMVRMSSEKTGNIY